MPQVKYNKTQTIKYFMLRSSSHIFRQQGAILREFNNNKES